MQRPPEQTRRHSVITAVFALLLISSACSLPLGCHLAAIASPTKTVVASPERCRSGFSTGELIAFLYARTFPRQEWEQRFNESQRGAKDT